jgi:hypothetical protein
MTAGRLRVPFLVLAIVLNLALVAAEVGLPKYEKPLAKLFEKLQGASRTAAAIKPAPEMLALFPPDQRSKLQELIDEANKKANETEQQASQASRPFGFGLRNMWLVDGLLLFTLLLIGLGVVVPPEVQARIQGLFTCFFALFVILMAIVLVFVALAAVVLMISVLVAFPFGTIIYLIAWGHFDRSGAAAVLALFFTIKLMISGAIVLAHQNFLQNLGLVLLVIGTLAANLVVSFLHGLVPGFLVSISDGVAGIVVGIVGGVLALILLIGAVFSIISALRA